MNLRDKLRAAMGSDEDGSRPTPEMIRQAMNHMFEYNIVYGGKLFRIGRCRHEDARPLVEEWVGYHFDSDNPWPQVYVFQDDRLWEVLEYEDEIRAVVSGQVEQTIMKFRVVSILFGCVAEPIVEDDRVRVVKTERAN